MSNAKDVRLKVNNVKSKKVEDVFTLSFDYCDIKHQRISSADNPKIRLQIVCHDDTMTTFHFSNPLGSVAQRKDRDEVNNLLSLLLPQSKSMINQALEVNAKILNENQTIYQLYKDLVISGLVQADKFWSKYVDVRIPIIETECSTNIRPESNDKGGLIYKLNIDTIMSIFRTYPASIYVDYRLICKDYFFMFEWFEKKYDQNVSTRQLTDSEFWRTFVQSHYFTVDRVHPSHSHDLFADYVKKDDEKMHAEAERASRKAIAIIAPETNETSEIGYGVNENAGETVAKNDINKNLIKRFNFHSTMILKSTLGTDTTTI